MSNFFPELRDQVEILPTGWLNTWLSKKARPAPKKNQKKPSKSNAALPAQPEQWATRKLIAYPVHSPNHWTLCILINKSWPKAGKDWAAFHFDSFKCNSYAAPTAQSFGLYVTGIKHRCDLPIKDVTVPQQNKQSNDCGLWAAHFLKIVLKNFESCTEVCNSVRLFIFT